MGVVVAAIPGCVGSANAGVDTGGGGGGGAEGAGAPVVFIADAVFPVTEFPCGFDCNTAVAEPPCIVPTYGVGDDLPTSRAMTAAMTAPPTIATAPPTSAKTFVRDGLPTVSSL